MNIKFQTNIDAYKTNCFPENLTFVPRKGEFVFVSSVFVNYFKEKKLPIKLEVVSVNHTEQGIYVELWYNDTDRKLAELAGAKTL